jgi:RNA polymerase sigma-70 factor (ECF subfamily)
MPGEPEALGLLALVLHAEARRPARRDAAGDYVPLGWQDPALWDAAMIAEAEALIRRAAGLGRIGRFQLEAALQSAHAHRCRSGEGDWPRVVELYDALLALSASPVVAINRALAVARLEGAAAGLAALDAVASDPRLAEYQPWWAARAELLAKAGAVAGARHAYALAIGLERDPAVRRFLQQTQAALPEA